MIARGHLNLPGDWETRLERKLLGGATDNQLVVYICSPLRSGTAEGTLGNMRVTRAYMYYACVNLGVLPKAPHAYMTVLLNDNNPLERELALDFGLMLLQQCDSVFVCGDRLTDGMYTEIIEAIRWGKPVRVWHEAVLTALVPKLITDGVAPNVLLGCEDDAHEQLSWGAKRVCGWIGGV